VGDSLQQNGLAKKGVVLAKRRIITLSISFGEKKKIEVSDVIPMVNATYPNSFGNVEGNKCAINERGWNRMNHTLLLHKDLLKTRVDVPATETMQPESQDSQISTEAVVELNFGIMGDVIDSIVLSWTKRNGQAIELKERRTKQ
jgi:hypothetical protein